jgi:hypothetical protein
MWQWVRDGAVIAVLPYLFLQVTVIAALPYLFLQMQSSEDQLVPSAFSRTLPADAAVQDVIATKATAPAVPSEIVGGSPIVVPTAISDCPVTSPEPAATVGKALGKAKAKAVAKAKLTAKAPSRATPTKMVKTVQVAAVGRGSKEVRY